MSYNQCFDVNSERKKKEINTGILVILIWQAIKSLLHCQLQKFVNF